MTIFGPLTLLRPVVVIAGGILALRLAALPVGVLIVLVIALMLGFGPILDRLLSRRWR